MKKTTRYDLKLLTPCADSPEHLMVAETRFLDASFDDVEAAVGSQSDSGRWVDETRGVALVHNGHWGYVCGLTPGGIKRLGKALIDALGDKLRK